MAVRLPSATVTAIPTLKSTHILKNLLSVSGAMCVGDAVCQVMETVDTEKKLVWDHARTMRMGITGAFLVTPASFAWNMYAERLAPGKSVRAIITKAGVSVAVLPPMLATQFACLTLLEEGKNAGDVSRKLSRDFAPTLMNALLFWPLVNVANSLFVPVLSRPIFSSFMGVFWNVYISYQANHNGLEVGELSVVYPRAEAGVDLETAISKTVAVAEKTAERTAASAAATTVAVADGNATGVSVGSVNAASVTGKGDTKAVAGNEDIANAAMVDPPAPPARKKRGRLVRRTSVVSM